MAWWMKNNLRMIQNNLRDIDANMDIDKEIAMLKDFGANVVQLGCGGITAFHPSELDCQYRNPYMKGDPFGTWLEKCHENGIRVIARFDFSKSHDSFLAKHPEWFVKSVHGEYIRYHDTVATCVNGPYQQECSVAILEEVLRRYPVDGVFFNMFGYQTRDYSGNYTGICQCGSCKQRFFAASGMELPVEERMDDPAYLRYIQFKEETVGEILRKIHGVVKSFGPDIAVSTYHHESVDIIRNESNSAVDRPYPFWIYSSTDNVSEVEGSFEDKICSNVAINAVDLPYRFMGVSKHLNRLRLLGNIAAGSGLDWCIIGSFDDYPDRDNFESTKEVFRFHQRHEPFFGNLQSQAKILLVRPAAFYQAPFSMEFRGIFKMLKEEHKPFRVINHFMLDSLADGLDEYSVILLPEVASLSENAAAALRRTKAAVIATGFSFAEQPALLEGLFGIRLGDKLDGIRSSYCLTEPKHIFKSFPQRDWVYLDMDYRLQELLPGTSGMLPLVMPARFGPPERCYGHTTSENASISLRNNSAYLPWKPGSLYYQQGYEDFKYLLMNLLDHMAPDNSPVVTDAPKCVELFFDQCGENQYLLQLLNLSGFNGTTVFEPLPVHGITVRFTDLKPKRVFELTDCGTQECAANNPVCVDVLHDYKAFVLEVDK